MPEEWRPAPGWPAYEVSRRGRVRSVDRVLGDGRGAGGKLLTPVPDKDGYRYVTLANGAERWRVHVGRLVLMAFASWPPPGTEACHRNGRRWDNRAGNLYWGTKPQNAADQQRHRLERKARKSRKQDETAETPVPPLEDVAGVSPC